MGNRLDFERGYVLTSVAKPHEEEVRSDQIVLPSVGGPLFLIAGLAITLFGIGVHSKYGAPDFDLYDVLTKAAQLILLCSGLGSVLLVRRQMVAQQKVNLQTREREAKEFQYNRMEAFYKYFGDDSGLETQRAFEAILEPAGIAACFVGKGTEIVDQEKLTELVTNHKWDTAIRNYLDRHESLAAAVNSGFIDGEMAYCLQAGRILRAVKVLGHLIRKYQDGNPKAYCELIELNRAWTQERQKRADVERKRQEEIQRAARSGQVTKRFD